jgi:hypothetical protein
MDGNKALSALLLPFWPQLAPRRKQTTTLSMVYQLNFERRRLVSKIA